MADEGELKQIIRNNRGGTWRECAGPLKIGTANVWEIWTYKDKSLQIRFWLEDETKGEKNYFEYFCNLARYLDEQFESKKTMGEPGDLTIGQLIHAMKPSQLYAVLAAAVFALGGAVAFGAYFGG